MISPSTIKQKLRAFSLLELLVTIVIIATFACMSLANLNTASAKADGTRCMNNLCNLERAAKMWSADNNDRIFPNLSMNPYSYWPSILLGSTGPAYINSYTTFHCPCIDRAMHYNRRVGVYGSYGRSYFLSGSDGVPDFGGSHFDGKAQMSKIANPSRTVSFYDYDYWLNQQGCGDALGGAPADGSPGWYCKLHNLHGNGFNIVLMDGHAEWVPFNSKGKWGGYYSGDYPQFIWKPY
ncbi:MAG: prepilin-type N-terminal cleavage/methylation domain-containing protein [Chthoniobacterales bacterium]